MPRRATGRPGQPTPLEVNQQRMQDRARMGRRTEEAPAQVPLGQRYGLEINDYVDRPTMTRLDLAEPPTGLLQYFRNAGVQIGNQQFTWQTDELFPPPRKPRLNLRVPRRERAIGPMSWPFNDIFPAPRTELGLRLFCDENPRLAEKLVWGHERR